MKGAVMEEMRTNCIIKKKIKVKEMLCLWKERNGRNVKKGRRRKKMRGKYKERK
jgi:hypothetical protein